MASANVVSRPIHSQPWKSVERTEGQLLLLVLDEKIARLRNRVKRLDLLY